MRLPPLKGGEFVPRLFRRDGPALGSAPAHELFDLIDVPALGPDRAPRSFKEYTVTVKEPPTGVTLHRMVG